MKESGAYCGLEIVTGDAIVISYAAREGSKSPLVLVSAWPEAAFGCAAWPLENHNIIAGVRLTDIVAPMVLDGPVNSRNFQTYVDRMLIPALQPRLQSIEKATFVKP